MAKPESGRSVNHHSLNIENIHTDLDILSGHRGILCSGDEGIRAVVKVRLNSGYPLALQTSNIGILPPSPDMPSGIPPAAPL